MIVLVYTLSDPFNHGPIYAFDEQILFTPFTSFLGRTLDIEYPSTKFTFVMAA